MKKISRSINKLNHVHLLLPRMACYPECLITHNALLPRMPRYLHRWCVSSDSPPRGSCWPRPVVCPAPTHNLTETMTHTDWARPGVGHMWGYDVEQAGGRGGACLLHPPNHSSSCIDCWSYCRGSRLARCDSHPSLDLKVTRKLIYFINFFNFLILFKMSLHK